MDSSPGLYWQSRMGNNVDGIGGNCHRYRIVTRDAAGALGQTSFVVDYGIKMATERWGYACIFPSPEGLFARRGKASDGAPEALLLTHAHEDHLGGIRHALTMGYRLPPVYCTAYTAEILAKSLLNGGIEKAERPVVRIVKPGERIAIGGGEVEFVPVDHLPGSSALWIRSPDATAFHTGDYKFDPTLPLGPRANPVQLAEIGRQGVDLVVSDSTAAGDDSEKVFEREIQANLSRIIADNEGRAIVAGVLGTQLDRVASLARAAADNGRVTILTGRSLEYNVFALGRAGIDIEAASGGTILPASLAQHIPADQAVVVTTGAFAQAQAGLTRAAHRLPGALLIDKGSTVIIPQRAIPPVKAAFNAVVGKLESLGAWVITAENAPQFGYGEIHQSGHAIAADTAMLYGLLKPRALIAPMHGAPAQLEANAKIARRLGVTALPLDHNGTILRIDHQGATIVGKEAVARIGAVDTHDHKAVPRAKQGAERRDGPIPLYRYVPLDDVVPPTPQAARPEAKIRRMRRAGGR